jgi:hypothetical protein
MLYSLEDKLLNSGLVRGFSLLEVSPNLSGVRLPPHFSS